MGKSDDIIVECAIAVISQTGYKKTTMADLADAAGVSRQTLYNKFPNKEEVLRAAVRHAHATGLAEMKRRWSETESVKDKLEAFFQVGPLNWYDAIIASPDSADLIEGVNTHASDLMDEANKGWMEALTNLFKPYGNVLGQKGTSAEILADFVFATGVSAKYNATSRDQLVKRLATLKVAALALSEA